jgi:hypothetical protein
MVTVHTSGVNWESLSVILVAIGVAFSVFTWVILRRDSKRQVQNEEIKTEIKVAVDHLAEVLLLKLETKETVSKIESRLSRIEGAMSRADVDS